VLYLYGKISRLSSTIRSECIVLCFILISYESGKLKQWYLVIKLNSSILPVCKDLNKMCRAYLRVMFDCLHFNCMCVVMTGTAL